MTCAKMFSVFFRTNKCIKVITIDGTNYLKSQYADDTTFIVEASSQSLNSTLRLLDYRAEIRAQH